MVARHLQGAVLLSHLCSGNACRSVRPSHTWPRTARAPSLCLLRQHSGMKQHDHSSKTISCVSALFHLFVAALDIDLRMEWINTDANITDLPSRPFSGRGESSNTGGGVFFFGFYFNKQTNKGTLAHRRTCLHILPHIFWVIQSLKTQPSVSDLC